MRETTGPKHSLPNTGPDDVSKAILEREYETLTNNQKGYKHEYETLAIIESFNLDCDNNPRDWCDWIKNQHNHVGYDHKVFYNNRELKIECKYTSVPVFSNSFERDWLSRDCDIIVTSYIWNVSYEDRQKLKAKGVKLLDWADFYNYLMKLLYPTGTKDIKCHNNRVKREIRFEQESNQVLKQRYEQVLEEINAFRSKGYGRFENFSGNSTIKQVYTSKARAIEIESIACVIRKIIKQCVTLNQTILENMTRGIINGSRAPEALRNQIKKLERIVKLPDITPSREGKTEKGKKKGCKN